MESAGTSHTHAHTPDAGTVRPTVSTAILAQLLLNGAPSGQRLRKALGKGTITRTCHKVPSARHVCLLCEVLLPDPDSESPRGLKGQIPDLSSAVCAGFFFGGGGVPQAPSPSLTLTLLQYHGPCRGYRSDKDSLVTPGLAFPSWIPGIF